MTASKQQKQTADANGVTKVRDDVLEAVKIRAALSTSLITATGTAVVAGLAVVAFATQLHRVEAPALGFWAGASVAFFTSAVAGGLAIRQLTASGSTGDWGLRVPSKRYTVQILTFFLAAALLSIGTAIAFNDPSRASRDDDQDRLIRKLDGELLRERLRSQRLARRLGRIEGAFKRARQDSRRGSP